MLDPSLQAAAELAQLALVTWREARGQTRQIKAAVAWTVRTRAAKVENDIMGVIAQPWVYSSMTDSRDPDVTRWPLFSDTSYAECLEVASRVLTGIEPNPVPGADSYYDAMTDEPIAEPKVVFKGQLGRIRFYEDLTLQPEAGK